ncbi:MAG: hypothetical protein K1X72_18240 [Pyrinomonadaceae bacterium]|nr:hypothetical protein [Pyrinomonadaceae bacterium]
MSYTNEIKRNTNVLTFFEKVRLMLGVVMMISGLYFGLFTVGVGEGLGMLSFMASPFLLGFDK